MPSNVRDYIEIFRFIPLVLLLLIQNFIRLERVELEKLFLGYTVIDVIVSVAQFFRFDFINFITSLYAAGHHAEKSLVISSRALGLSSGPGQHGSIVALLFVFFFCGIFFRRSRFNVAGSILASISILLSQSQTAFIAVIISAAAIVIYYGLAGKVSQKIRAFKLASFISIFLAAFIGYFFQELRYLATLVTQGTDRNSFKVRLEKAETVYEGIQKTPELLITGYGKDYWGSFSAAMDNEYLYILAVYGLFIFMAAVIVVVIILFNGFLLKSANKDKSIYFIIVAGLIIAFPTAFFTDPRVILLLLFVTLSKNVTEPQAERSSTAILKLKGNL